VITFCYIGARLFIHRYLNRIRFKKHITTHLIQLAAADKEEYQAVDDSPVNDKKSWLKKTC
jgi:hypothetical protein